MIGNAYLYRHRPQLSTITDPSSSERRVSDPPSVKNRSEPFAGDRLPYARFMQDADIILRRCWSVGQDTGLDKPHPLMVISVLFYNSSLPKLFRGYSWTGLLRYTRFNSPCSACDFSFSSLLWTAAGSGHFCLLSLSHLQEMLWTLWRMIWLPRWTSCLESKKCWRESSKQQSRPKPKWKPESRSWRRSWKGEWFAACPRELKGHEW